MSMYIDNLKSGISDLFERDPRLILLGEDVVDPYGGAFKVTAGLSSRFPGRVMSTPISESGITGMAIGLALRGYVPLLEIMFGDFLTLCADQLVNHAAKFPRMYRDVACPLVVRTPMGGGRGYGPTHSQCLEKMFLGIPGLKLIAPSNFHRPGESIARVVGKETGPVIFLEHKLLYRETLLESSAELLVSLVDDETGYQTAVVRNYSEGSPDVSLITYGGVARLLPSLMTALAAEEIRVLAIIPESIDPPPIKTLARHCVEAGRVVIVEESTEGFTWGSSLASLLYEELWGSMRCPIRIVTSDRDIVPTSFDQEAKMLISSADIERAIVEVISWA